MGAIHVAGISVCCTALITGIILIVVSFRYGLRWVLRTLHMTTRPTAAVAPVIAHAHVPPSLLTFCQYTRA